MWYSAWYATNACPQYLCGGSEGTMTKITVTGNNKVAQEAARVAATIQAKVCLNGCEHCLKVHSDAPDKKKAGKIKAEACCVRSHCAIPNNLVRPPKNVAKPEDCPIRQRAEKKASSATVQVMKVA